MFVALRCSERRRSIRFHDLCNLLNILNKYCRTFLILFATRLFFLCKELNLLPRRLFVCIKLGVTASAV